MDYLENTMEASVFDILIYNNWLAQVNFCVFHKTLTNDGFGRKMWLAMPEIEDCKKICNDILPLSLINLTINLTDDIPQPSWYF